jgi:hypothetical protein
LATGDVAIKNKQQMRRSMDPSVKVFY